MLNEMSNKHCSKCDTKVTKKDIIAVGVRQNKVNSKTLYMEHCCPKCQYREMTACSSKKTGSLEEMCYVLLNSIQQKKKFSIPNKLEYNKNTNIPWTDKEISDFHTFINGCENHSDFLKHIKAGQYVEDENED